MTLAGMFRGLAILLGVLSPSLAFGQTGVRAAPAQEQASDISDSALRIRGIFDASLPGIERKNVLRFIFHPHLGDLTKRDYLRVPIGLRYGATQQLELTGEINGFVSHGLGDEAFGKRYGFYDVHLAAKYNLGEPFRRGWETAIGLDYVYPVGSPPMDLTDGLTHLAPYIAFSHRLVSFPKWRVFWGTGVDLVSQSGVYGRLEDNDLGENANSVNAGFVWDRGPVHYTLEASFATTRVLSDIDRDVFTLRPGFVWQLPRKWTPTEGRWLVGAGLRTTFGEQGTDFGASAKLRVDFNLKRWWKKTFGDEKPTGQ